MGLSFLDGAVPPAFELASLCIAPGAEYGYRAAAWAGALVVLEAGEIDVLGLCGARIRFVSGDVLWLADLPIRALYNPGPDDALLSIVRRRTGARSLPYDQGCDD